MIKIPNYKTIKKIGSGGMGDVYLAEHKVLETTVAIKSLHNNLVNDESFRTRFRTEAKIHSKLDHPNVVKLIDFQERKDGLFIIMEYVEGKQLDDYIKNESGPITEKELVPLFLQIVDAISHAHAKGLVHRDIKPSNVIISKGKIKVLDFGIAKELSTESGLTKTGMQIGTASYMSPEQVNAEKVDKLTDIYSLGVTLFQMAVGQSPYSTTTNTFKIQQKIVGEPFPNPKDIYPSISDKLVAIIEKATQKDKKDRYQSCEEFKKDLNASSVKRSVIESPKVKKEIANKERSTSSKVLIRALIIGAVIFAGYMWSNDYFEQNRKDDYLSYYKSAKQYQEDEHYQTAINYYDKCIDIYSDCDSIIAFKGECYYKKESYQDAIGNFTKAIDINSNNAEYYLNRGKSLTKLKKHKDAIKDYDKAIKIKPASSYYYLRRGYDYWIQNLNNRAKIDFTKSIELDANSINYDYRGRCNFDLNRYNDAKNDYTKSLNFIKNAETYYKRGNANYRLGKLASAIDDYTQAILLDFTYTKAYRNRGIARYESCKTGACADLKKAGNLGDIKASNEYLRIKNKGECK